VAVINGAHGLAICAVIDHHVFSMGTPPGIGELGIEIWMSLQRPV